MARTATRGRRMHRWALMLVLAAVGCEEPPRCIDGVGFVCPVAGTGEYGFNRDGLPAGESDLFLVSAARRGPDGLVYVMDFNNQRFRVIDEDGRMQTVVGDGFHAIAALEVDPTDSPLENPIDFGFYADGRVVFVSYHDPRVIEIGTDGLLHAVAGAGPAGVEGDEGDGGPALEALLMQPDGIAVAPDDAVYISDSLAHRVRLVRDGIITTVAGSGERTYSGDGGPGVEAGLNWPTALELDRDGNLYIADSRNHAVRRLAADGTITTIAGTGTAGYGGDGGPAAQAQLDEPNGLALDGEGSIYIADRGNHRVRAVGPDGIIETIAGTGVDGDAGDGGPALSAEYGYLARVAWDDGALLLADQSNSRVRRIDLRQ